MFNRRRWLRAKQITSQTERMNRQARQARQAYERSDVLQATNIDQSQMLKNGLEIDPFAFLAVFTLSYL
jgi:hypothetical protein